MAYKEHLRFTARFNLGPSTTPRELATCTLNFSPVSTFVQPNHSAMVGYSNDIFDAWALFLMSGDAGFSSAVRLAEVRGYIIGTDGRMKTDTTPAYSTRGAAPGSASANTHPWQNSIVVTLDSGPPAVGRWGRIFLPPQAYTIDHNEGTLTTAEANDILAATKSFLEDASNKPGIDGSWRLCVASGVGEGHLRPVTTIKIGKVVDTQRRRRRSLDEAHVVAGLDV